MKITREEVLAYHLGGKVGLKLTKPLRGPEDLSRAYTPGVAMAVKEIAANPPSIRAYTAKSNLVAVVTDGTAILGLGDLGACASIPVMEGKAVLFKAFGDVDAWPVPLENCRKGGRTTGPTDPQLVIDHTAALAPMYGGINLEDIAAPACFEIEDKLDAMLDIPVFHDDQWGTAVITLAGIINYCKLSGRKLADLSMVINGAGAAGIRIADVLKARGAKNIVICDSKGVISTDRKDLNPQKQGHAVATKAKTVADAMRGAQVFIGVSVADCINADNIKAMDSYPAVFAMANPDPEVRPEVVKEALGKKPYVMATGRSDYPNQINNVLGFPFLFRGALDTNARTINIAMKLAASEALANLARQPVPDQVQDLFKKEDLEFSDHYIVPKPFDRRLFVEIPFAVAKAAIESGVAQKRDLAAYRAELEQRNASRE